MTTETQQAPEPRGIEDRLAALEEQMATLALRVGSARRALEGIAARHADCDRRVIRQEPSAPVESSAALEQQVSALALRLNQMATWQASAQRTFDTLSAWRTEHARPAGAAPVDSNAPVG